MHEDDQRPPARPGIPRRAALAVAALAGLATRAGAQSAPPVPTPGRPMLLRGATILSMDPALGDLPVGDILIRDARFAAIGPRLDAPPDAEIVDAGGTIALPGFVNGHIHLAQTLQRGLSTEHAFADYFPGIVLKHSNRMAPADVALADRAGALEQLSLGTTTVVDWSRETPTPEHAEAALDGLAATGIRALLLYTAPPRPTGGDDSATRRMVAHAQALRRGRLAAGDALIRLGACLPGPDFMPIEPALADLAALRELGLLVSFHCGAPIYPLRKPRIVADLAARKLLPDGVQVVHANGLDDDEFRMLAAIGGSLATTPEVEMRMGHGHPALFRAQAAGLAVSIGTDIPSAVGGGLLPQLRVLIAAEGARANVAALAATGRAVPRPPLSARAALEAATIGGARAVGLGDVTGSITPGKRADLLLLRADAPATSPALDAIGTVALQASAGDIEAVFVDGVAKKWNGRLTDPAAPAVFAAARARAAAMVSG